MEAVSTERFEYAKKIKSAIGELKEAGLILGSLEMEKQIYADTGEALRHRILLKAEVCNFV